MTYKNNKTVAKNSEHNFPLVDINEYLRSRERAVYNELTDNRVPLLLMEDFYRDISTAIRN